MAPTSSKQWQVTGPSGFQGLKFTEAKIPALGERDVLVKWHYASLNYRDLIISKGQAPFTQKDDVVPGSDGAGEVIGIGARVTMWKAGDRVVSLFLQAHQDGPVKPHQIATALGGALDGTLQEYGVLDETGLISLPDTLSFQQASTLPCAAVTAWNALYGLEGRKVTPGQWVLTQGTGGVSVFALQFAKAAGARVIATSSSTDKLDKLTRLGADHVINYKENPKWGEEARRITGGAGVDHIVEVGGPQTLRQSLTAVRIEGLIAVAGFVSGSVGDIMPNAPEAAAPTMPSMLEVLATIVTVRGVMVGSKAQFEAMNACIDANRIKPVLDDRVFELKDLKDAYQYMWDQKHVGKVTIKIA